LEFKCLLSNHHLKRIREIWCSKTLWSCKESLIN
jgi:hypothetical protein